MFIENINGLIRQYVKKGSKLTKATDQDLAIISSKLNNRPRKTLNYKSSNEFLKAKETFPMVYSLSNR